MRYFVKLAGKAFGPLEEEKIVEIYNAGRLKDPVEISRDKKVWDSIDIILPKLPPPEIPSVEPTIDSAPMPAVGEITQKFIDPNAPVWFYSVDGLKGYGPVTKSDLATMLQCSMLNARSLVWRQGENSRPISIVPELAGIFVSGASTASSVGYGGEISSLPPLPPAQDNYLIDGNSMSNSFQNLGGAHSSYPIPSGNRSANANMFDLLNDPNFENDAYGLSQTMDRSQVGQISRMSYVLMAIFFGQLGIHNFYAKRMDIAIVQLFIGLTNLVTLLVIMFISMFTAKKSYFLFSIPAIIAFGLELWSIIETCVVTHDGTGKRMY